jgi:hypothetical protein
MAHKCQGHNLLQIMLLPIYPLKLTYAPWITTGIENLLNFIGANQG